MTGRLGCGLLNADLGGRRRTAMNDRMRLIEELYTGSTPADRCPHLRHVGPGARQCAAVRQAEPAGGGHPGGAR